MATSTLMKFSLLTIIVVLSSYIIYIEAVSACLLSPNPSSTTILKTYNCTVANCTTALGSCTGPHCSKRTEILLILLVQLQ